MIIFMSQAPILVVTIPVIFLIALLEMVGLKARRNIAVLSAVSLLCLVVAALIHDGNSALAEMLFAVGVVLAVIVALYAMATAYRGRQWGWFAGLLIAVAITLGALVDLRVAVPPLNTADIGPLLYALNFVPVAGALTYGIFGPDIPKLRGSN